MKHIKLILSVTILLTLCINAYSFPDSTASWTDDIAHCYSDWDHALYQYEVNGNTSINSKQYYKIYASGNRDIYDTGYAGAIRSDSSFVYIVLKDSTSEFILYDFSLEKGDVFYSHFFSRNVPVDSVDSINFAGEKRKRIIF